MADLRIIAIGYAVPLAAVVGCEPGIVSRASYIVTANTNKGGKLQRSGPVANLPYGACGFTANRKVAMLLPVLVVA